MYMNLMSFSWKLMKFKLQYSYLIFIYKIYFL